MALVELGQEQIGEIIASSNPNMIDINTETQTVIGDMYFEMSNHLGNVLATITDRKTYNPNDGYYEPVITMKADYYAFGMLMPNRFEGVDDTRHLFNGMEHDMEVSGEGNSYTTEFRQYDPRLGRWKSLDPLMAQFPWQSPYVAFDNNPIFYTDPLGLASEGGRDGEPVKGEPIENRG
jgi:RHS repeat-associated protein